MAALLFTEAEVDNTLRDLQTFFISYESTVNFNRLLYYTFKIFPRSDNRSFAISLFAFLLTKNNATSSPCFLGQRIHSYLQRKPALQWRAFDVIQSIITCSALHFWRPTVSLTAAWLWWTYACGFNQSETRKYLEWIIINN